LNIMTKDVLIEIKSMITSDGTTDEIESAVNGSYFDKDNGIYILYEEESEEGIGIKSRLKISGGKMELKKQGAYTMQMTFDTEETTKCFYSTPYGTMAFDVKTDEMITDVKRDMVNISLKYVLLSEDSIVSEHGMNIIIKPAR